MADLVKALSLEQCLCEMLYGVRTLGRLMRVRRLLRHGNLINYRISSFQSYQFQDIPFPISSISGHFLSISNKKYISGAIFFGKDKKAFTNLKMSVSFTSLARAAEGWTTNLDMQQPGE